MNDFTGHAGPRVCYHTGNIAAESPTIPDIADAEEVVMYRVLSLCTILVLLVGSASAGTMQDDNKAKTQRFYDEVLNQGKIAAADEYLAEDFVDHEPFPGVKPGREGCKQFFSMMRDAFPDLKFDVHFMLADGDKVAAYLTMSGTQSKEFAGIPSSGKKFSVNVIDIIRIVDGKAVEHWGVTDGMTMMQQLGAMPAPPPPPGK